MKVTVRGFEMAYEDTGDSSTFQPVLGRLSPRIPLLLIHGFPLDRTLWAAQALGLAEDARVITPDLRGFGESGMPGDKTVTMDTYADDLRALLDALGVKSAVIGGLSMGGYIALAFYRKYAHRVRALILANTRAHADTLEGKKGRDDSIALARAKGAAAIAEKMLPRMLIPRTAALRSEIADQVQGMMARQPVRGIVAALAAMRDRPDSMPMLARITVPTLIIASADDSLIPLSEAEAMRDAIRGARLVTIPHAAHLSNAEQPGAFNQAVREFLKSVT